MKSLIPLSLLVLLVGCSSFQQFGAPVFNRAHPVNPSAVAQQKANLVFNEATRLAGEVQRGTLTRLQAADQLNLYRLRLVGANRVDDSTFAVYRYLARERDNGALSAEASHARMESKLREWQQQWPRLRNRPADPAFTNFLMKVFAMPMLDVQR